MCLHCGELASDGGLFCTKCGFTLPQAGVAGPVDPPGPARNPAATWAPPSTPVTTPPPTRTAVAPSAPPAVGPPPPPPGILAPPAAVYYPPPPNGKYCTRCGTIIARPAVYCPVCQQPQ